MMRIYELMLLKEAGYPFKANELTYYEWKMMGLMIFKIKQSLSFF